MVVVPFLYAAQELDKVKSKGDDHKAGVDLVRKALEAPIRQITNECWCRWFSSSWKTY